MLKDFAYEEVNMDKKITNIEIVDNLIQLNNIFLSLDNSLKFNEEKNIKIKSEQEQQSKVINIGCGHLLF